MTSTKQFCISKNAVMDSWRCIRSNKGSAGVDGESIEEFEKDLKGNLYKIWNRMSSGTYFPPPVRTVSIPKKSGTGKKKARNPHSRGPCRTNGCKTIL